MYINFMRMVHLDKTPIIGSRLIISFVVKGYSYKFTSKYKDSLQYRILLEDFRLFWTYRKKHGDKISIVLVVQNVISLYLLLFW